MSEQEKNWDEICDGCPCGSCKNMCENCFNCSRAEDVPEDAEDCWKQECEGYVAYGKEN